MSRSSGRSTAKTAGHRIRFHLAPLVDLLLIIVFAQLLEIRTTVRDQTIAFKRQIAQSDQQVEQLRVEQSISREQQQTERERTMKAVGTIAEIFNLSKQQVREFATHGDADAAEILRRVAEQAQSMSTDSPEKVIRFLVGHQELLKRAEIWNLHVGGDRKVTLSFADQQLRFGLERKGQDARTTEFEDALFAAYKQLPQPKELVVILASYSNDAVAGIYQPMIDGTPRALERMRTDDPTTRFEYTVLGATASPESSEPTPTETAQ